MFLKPKGGSPLPPDKKHYPKLSNKALLSDSQPGCRGTQGRCEKVPRQGCCQILICSPFIGVILPGVPQIVV